MGETETRVGYVDWDEVVQKSEANIQILHGNMRRAEVGLILEKKALSIAKIERRKYPEPAKETMEDEKTSDEEESSEDTETKED